MDYRVTEIDAEWGRAKALEWGYNRPIEDGERDRSRWFAYGASLIFWFDRVLPCEVALHVCVAPHARRRVYARKLVYAFDIIAEWLGAARIIGWFVPGEEAEGLVERLGWRLLDPSASGPGHRCWVRDLPTIEMTEET